MAVIKVQKLPEKKIKAGQLLAEFCLYYPAYTYEVARYLPAKRVMMMIREARRKEARHYYNLTQIAAAPHTQNGSGVKRLAERFKSQMDE